MRVAAPPAEQSPSSCIGSPSGHHPLPHSCLPLAVRTCIAPDQCMYQRKRLQQGHNEPAGHDAAEYGTSIVFMFAQIVGALLDQVPRLTLTSRAFFNDVLGECVVVPLPHELSSF